MIVFMKYRNLELKKKSCKGYDHNTGFDRPRIFDDPFHQVSSYLSPPRLKIKEFGAVFI